MIYRFQFLLAFALVASCLAAQDTRTVIEPLFPQLCTTLDAQLHTDGHSLAPPTSRSSTPRAFKGRSTNAARARSDAPRQ